MNRKVIDLATNITIVGSLLYLIGWEYLEKFYESLGFNTSFVDMSIEQVLTSTWHKQFFLFLIFLTSISFLVSRKTKLSDIRIVLFFTTNPIVLALSLHIFDSTISLIVYSSVTVIIMALLIFFGGLIGKSFKEIILKNARETLLLIMFSTSIYIVSDFGRADAKNLCMNYVEDAQLYFSKNGYTQKVMFISIINDRYFVLKKENETIIPIVYEAQEISKIYFGN